MGTSPPSGLRDRARTSLPSRLLLIAGGLVAGLAAAEGLLWSFFPATDEVREALVQTLPGVKREIVYATNAFGMRSLSLTRAKKPPRTVRILCLGASTTNQPTQATADIWSAVLERMLAEEFAGSGWRIEVAAWGIGGQRVFHRVAWCAANLDRFRPDLIVTLEGINDLCYGGGAGYAYSGPEARLAEIAGERTSLAGLKAWLRSRSQVVRRVALLRRSLRIAKARAAGMAFEWHSRNLPDLRAARARLPLRDEVVRSPDPFDEFRDGMEALLSLARSRGVEVVVLGQPAVWRAGMSPEEEGALWLTVETPQGRVRGSPEWLARELARYNAAQRRLAERAGATYVPLDEMLPRMRDVFFDDCHFTDVGNVAVARAIFPAVAERVRALLAQRDPGGVAGTGARASPPIGGR